MHGETLKKAWRIFEGNIR